MDKARKEVYSHRSEESSTFLCHQELTGDKCNDPEKHLTFK